GLRVDPDVQDHGAVKAFGPAEHRFELGRVVDLPGGDAEAPGDGDEVGAAQVHRDVALPVRDLLDLADHSQRLVVEDRHLHRNAVRGCGGQLREAHLEAAVAHDAPDAAAGNAQLRPEGRREAEAHGAEAARGD